MYLHSENKTKTTQSLNLDLNQTLLQHYAECKPLQTTNLKITVSLFISSIKPRDARNHRISCDSQQNEIHYKTQPT